MHIYEGLTACEPRVSLDLGHGEPLLLLNQLDKIRTLIKQPVAGV